MPTPLPPWRTVHSLPANLGTAMLLVDYAVHGTATPTPWAHAAATRLSPEGKERLQLMRAVLAHGSVLRSWLLAQLPPDHEAHRSWSALWAWLTHVDLTDLVTAGIRSGLHWDNPSWDAAELEQALGDPARRTESLHAVLRSWGADRPQEALALALDSVRFKAELLLLLQELWTGSLEPGWLAAENELAATADRLDQARPAAADPIELVAALTGLIPAESWAQRLQNAPSLLFIPSLNLGRYLSIMQEEGEPCLILFEPTALREPRRPGLPAPVFPGEPLPGLSLWDLADLGNALVGLGDPNRLAILNLLASKGELYGQQIVEQVAVHQSTVSRNLALLESGGLVQVRREGNMKRYILDRSRIHEVCRLLSGALG